MYNDEYVSTKDLLKYTSYKKYVDELLNSNGRVSHVYIPMSPLIKTKELQRAVHKYAGNGVVSTYENTNHELVVSRIHVTTSPNLNLKTIEKDTDSKKTPFIFKVGDKGKTVAGESYEVVERTVALRVKITDKFGRVRNAIRKENGEVVNGCSYQNKEKYKLLPPTEKRTVYLNVYPKNTFSHDTLEAAKRNADKDVLAVGIPVMIEFSREESSI